MRVYTTLVVEGGESRRGEALGERMRTRRIGRPSIKRRLMLFLGRNNSLYVGSEFVQCSMDWSSGEVLDYYIERMIVKGKGGLRSRGVSSESKLI